MTRSPGAASPLPSAPHRQGTSVGLVGRSWRGPKRRLDPFWLLLASQPFHCPADRLRTRIVAVCRIPFCWPCFVSSLSIFSFVFFAWLPLFFLLTLIFPPVSLLSLLASSYCLNRTDSTDYFKQLSASALLLPKATLSSFVDNDVLFEPRSSHAPGATPDRNTPRRSLRQRQNGARFPHPGRTGPPCRRPVRCGSPCPVCRRPPLSPPRCAASPDPPAVCSQLDSVQHAEGHPGRHRCLHCGHCPALEHTLYSLHLVAVQGESPAAASMLSAVTLADTLSCPPRCSSLPSTSLVTPSWPS